MNGILLIDKPKGWTSFDVVAKVRGVLKKELATRNSPLETPSRKVKVGHTGTLDPLATGLLVILLGNYTKRAPELTKLDKVYEVTMKLGQTSTTGDDEGDKTTISSEKPALAELKVAIKSFEGEIEQVPPAFSAVKVNGQRAYKLARAGKEVKIEPRQVKIYKITDIKYTYPTTTFTVHVSSGTYIRSLTTDIGEKLGTGAYMSDLRRTRVGEFDISNATNMDNIDSESVYKNLRPIDKTP